MNIKKNKFYIGQLIWVPKLLTFNKILNFETNYENIILVLENGKKINQNEGYPNIVSYLKNNIFKKNKIKQREDILFHILKEEFFNNVSFNQYDSIFKEMWGIEKS